MRAALHDVAALVDQDQVRAQDGRQPVGDGERGAARHGPLDGRLDEPLADGVEGAGRLVEDEDAGVLEQHPGQRDALLLATRQLVAPLAHDRVVAVGQLHDPVVDGRQPRGRVQLLVGGLGPGVQQVHAHRAVEQVRLLGHDADDVPEAGLGDLAHVDAVDLHGALVHVVQPGHEVGGRGLARTGVAHERHQLARLDAEVDVVERERDARSACRRPPRRLRPRRRSVTTCVAAVTAAGHRVAAHRRPAAAPPGSGS